MGLAPGDKRGPGRNADRAVAVGLLEAQALGRQLVEVRGAHAGVPGAAEGVGWMLFGARWLPRAWGNHVWNGQATQVPLCMRPCGSLPQALWG